MHTLLTRCTILGLLVGGFTVTGDAGWIVRRVQSLLEATSVPSAMDPDESTAPPENPDVPAPGGATRVPPLPAFAHQPAAAGLPDGHTRGLAGSFPLGPVDVRVAPSLATPADLPPIGGGEVAVDLRLLHPGQQVRLWTKERMMAFGMVDPASGEAIEWPQTRRVRISGLPDRHKIDRGGMIVVYSRTGISGHQPPPETLGPIQAIVIETP